MDVFVKSIAWQDMLFAKTGRGDIWRMWFKLGFDGGPIMEQLFGDEPEWQEPIARLNRFNIEEYLTKKANAVGLRISDQTHWVNNKDGKTFLLSRGSNHASISISGLEEIQNSSYETMRDLLDCRFEIALASLDKMGGLKPPLAPNQN